MAQPTGQSEAVQQVSARLTPVRTARAQFTQRIDVDKESPLRMTFLLTEANGKGKTTDEAYFLNDTDLFMPFVTLIALSGLVATARLELNAHTIGQVSAGLGLGMLVSGLAVFWLI